MPHIPIKLSICIKGDPVLEKVATLVMDVMDSSTQTFIDNLMYTYQQAKGVGIAAPQVGVSLRLFIIQSAKNDRYPDAVDTEPLVIINPEVLEKSPETVDGPEGCLSIPGKRMIVTRHQWVRARFTNRDGKIEERTFEGFLARVFQHEHDHINGFLITDRVKGGKIYTEEEYAAYERRLKENA